MKAKMQISKTEIRSYILTVAKRLFLEKGYLKTSIRDIAQAGDISVGRIYVYFKKKEDIFYALIEPIMVIMNEMNIASDISAVDQRDKISVFFNAESFEKMLFRNIEIIKSYQSEYELAFFKAEGFKKIDIRNEIVNSYCRNHQMMLSILQKNNYIKNLKNSEQTLQTIAELYVNIYENVLSANMSKSELELYIKEMADFIYYGYLGIFKKLTLEKLS